MKLLSKLACCSKEIDLFVIAPDIYLTASDSKAGDGAVIQGYKSDCLVDLFSPRVKSK